MASCGVKQLGVDGGGRNTYAGVARVQEATIPVRRGATEKFKRGRSMVSFLKHQEDGATIDVGQIANANASAPKMTERPRLTAPG